MAADLITDHYASPGPSYWDWRCTVCSEPVACHKPHWFWQTNIGPFVVVFTPILAIILVAVLTGSVHWGSG